MKTKICLTIAAIATLSFFSFKTATREPESKAAMVSLVNGKGENEGFVITYGDGKIERRNFEVKILKVESWIELQSKMTMVINEMKEKGYHYVGTQTIIGLNGLIFEKN